MFDFHNHFTNEDACLVTGDLLPQNYKGQNIADLISESEIGLDKRFVNIMSKEEQIKHLEKCLDTAFSKKCNVHIHCVGFTEETIKAISKFKFEPKTVLWHRFHGSFEIAKVLYKLGVLVSIANNYTENIQKLYNSNPLLVLETDYEGSDILEHRKLIEENYRKTASSLGVSIDQLEEMVLNAGKTFTNNCSSWRTSSRKIK